MKLRFKALLIRNKLKISKKKIIFLLVVNFCHFFSQTNVSLSELKIEAERLFEEEEYLKAYKPYSQLVSNYPKDPEYNYRLGVCMLYSEPDKKKCISYLKLASNNQNDAPKDVIFFLGKAYHFNYLFDEAIKYYNAYKKTASSSQLKKNQVDREITACQNGKRLLSNMSDLEIQSKKQLNEMDYFRSYDLNNIGGKLLVKPEEFKSAVDKKKKEKTIVFLPKLSKTVYYSSYGETQETGKDIYYAFKLPDNTYSKPEKVKGINTEFDEDYPFLKPDGKILYFASKGFNSMGGYDIFKSVYDDETKSWGKPINLEFPINSPDDDFLFVTDSTDNTAYFSTGRQSPPGKIDVLKIKIQRKLIDMIVMKGKVISENKEQALKSTITIKNIATEQNIGSFISEQNGDYLMDLPNGSNLLFTVQTPGFKTQTETVKLPIVKTSKPFRQTISYDNGILKINNYFDEATSDDLYLQYLKEIEKKAKLNVNQGENKLNDLITKNEKTEIKAKEIEKVSLDTKNSQKTDVDEKKLPKDDPSGFNNTQLADIYKQDAQESEKEAKQLKTDVDEAFAIGNKKKIDSELKNQELENEITKANLITNSEEKKVLVDKLIIKKQINDQEIKVASQILIYAKSMQEDYANKKKESDLNIQYSKELEKSSTQKNNNTETIKKLDEIQKQISEITNKPKNSEKIIDIIKDEIVIKEKQLNSLEEININNNTNLKELQNSISESEMDLSKTKKKTEKKEILSQIENLKNEKIKTEQKITAIDLNIKDVSKELDVLNREIDLINTIKNKSIDVLAINELTNQSSDSIVSDSIDNETIASQNLNNKLQEKYKNKIIITDSKNTSNISQTNAELSNYNEEINRLIETNNGLLGKANQLNKQIIETEITKLKLVKNNNENQIIENTKQIDSLNKSIASNENLINENPNLIAEEKKVDFVNQLESMDSKIVSEKPIKLEFDSYQNTEAQKIKNSVDLAINESIAKENNLRDSIKILKNKIQSNLNSENQTIESLGIQVEKINNKLVEINNYKLASYQKLFDANNYEMEQINSDLKNKLSNSEVPQKLKSDYDSVITVLENSKRLINTNQLTNTPVENLQNITMALKAQNDAYKQLSLINQSYNITIQDSKNTNSVTIQITDSLTQNAKVKNTETNIKTDSTAISVSEVTPFDNPNQLNNTSKIDSSANEIIASYENVKYLFKNTNAISMMENGIKVLKQMDLESKNLKSRAKDTTSNNVSPNEVLKNKIESNKIKKGELENLVIAYSLEYKSNTKLMNLNKAKRIEKNNADLLNAESNRLLYLSTTEKNIVKKIELLALSVKTGILALNKLNDLIQSINILPNATNTVSNVTKIEGLIISNENAYSLNNPIPLNEKIEDALVFRVQIGAFKTLLKNSAFKGLKPVRAERRGNGFFIYTAGNYPQFETANTVKNELRKLGYKDAFVVSYFNGKRININATKNLAKAQNNPEVVLTQNIPNYKELKNTNGLFFTIQIGLFNKMITSNEVYNLNPLYTEKIQNNLYRYTAGIYNSISKIKEDKAKVNVLGIKDAFITAYFNNKRITFTEAKNLQKNDSSIKMESENPIIFSNAITDEIINVPNITIQNTTNTTSNTPLIAFTNSVTNYPLATSDNGIKINDEGVCFKVQIGAFSFQLTESVAAKFSGITNWPIENQKINDLFIYSVGNFSEPKFAISLKEQAVNLGITDAFITVFKNGKKLYGVEAALLLGR